MEDGISSEVMYAQGCTQGVYLGMSVQVLSKIS